MRALFVLAAALPSIVAGQSAKWPQFRGPNASGIAESGAAPPSEFGLSNRLLWKRSLPLGHSSPAVWNDRVFLTAFEPDAKKGEILWRQAAPSTEIEETHMVSNPARQRPKWITNASTRTSPLMA
jgi:hypothetical protein